MTKTELPDLNVLLAASSPRHAHHGVARKWMRQADAIATTPATEWGLVRLLTNRAVIETPLSIREAVRAVEVIRDHDGWEFWPDSSTPASPAVDLSRLSGHRQVPDFQLVGLCIARGGTLVTLDRRIARALSPADRAFVRTLTD